MSEYIQEHVDPEKRSRDKWQDWDFPCAYERSVTEQYNIQNLFDSQNTFAMVKTELLLTSH